MSYRIVIDCPECKGTGYAEYKGVRNPWESEELRCQHPGCQSGEVEVDGCEICELPESECKGHKERIAA